MNMEKERKTIEPSKEKSEKIRKFFEDNKNAKKPSFNNHEFRIKALEEAVAHLMEKQNIEDTITNKI